MQCSVVQLEWWALSTPKAEDALSADAQAKASSQSYMDLLFYMLCVGGGGEGRGEGLYRPSMKWSSKLPETFFYL